VGKETRLWVKQSRNRTTHKIASAGKDEVEGALNVLVRVREKTGNLWNDLKKNKFNAVSSLRKNLLR
jgi:hypothetical protein